MRALGVLVLALVSVTWLQGTVLAQETDSSAGTGIVEALTAGSPPADPDPASPVKLTAAVEIGGHERNARIRKAHRQVKARSRLRARARRDEPCPIPPSFRP